MIGGSSSIGLLLLPLRRQLGGGSTHTVGAEGAGVYDVVVPCVLPPSSYIIYTVAAAP